MAETIGNCFNIDYVNKRVYNNQSYTDIFTVNQLYSYIQDTFDELAQLDDTVPMSAQTPNAYTLINGWYMDDVSFKYLKEGAIKTEGWASGVIRIKAYDATGAGTAFTGTDIGETITETDSGDTGTILAYDQRTASEVGMVWIRTITGTFADVNSAYTVSNSSAAGVFTAASSSGESLWPNVYTLGSIMEDGESGFKQQIYIAQDGARIFSGSEWWPEGGDSASTRHIDVLIKTKELGTEINNGLITVYLRHYPATLPARGTADLYDHFDIDLTAGGRNAVPLSTSADLNNTTDDGTVATYSDITIAFVNGTVTYSAISAAFTDFEDVSGSSSCATAVFLYQTTTTGAGTMTLGNVVGDFNADDTIQGATQTANCSSTLTEAYTLNRNFQQQSSYPYSVIVDCYNHTVAEVYEYFKYITRIGSTFATYPTDETGGTITHQSVQGQLYIAAHTDDEANDNFSAVKASPFGTFAGGKLFGARGVWIENMDDADIQAYQLIDSNGLTRTPPNQISITVSNTEASDRVAVFLTTGGAGSTTIDKAQYTAAAGNTSGETNFIITADIPSDTPSAGGIRVVDVSETDSTRETRYTFTSWSGSTFAGLSPALDRTYSASNDKAYVPYIDAEATTTSIASQVIYSTDRFVLVRVRRYASTAILPFQTTGTIISSGYSIGTIRTTDSLVDL